MTAQPAGSPTIGADRATGWFPLVVFGLETLMSAPLYARFGVEGTPCGGYCDDLTGLPGSTAASVGGIATTGSPVIAVFWLAAAALGYLVIGVFYRFRSRRRGAGVSATAYVLTGLTLVGLLASPVSLSAMEVFTDLFARGMTTLITVALALFVLARTHHSWPLTIFAMVFLGLVLMVTLTDLAAGGSPISAIVVGAVLLLAGTALGLAELLIRRKPA